MLHAASLDPTFMELHGFVHGDKAIRRSFSAGLNVFRPSIFSIFLGKDHTVFGFFIFVSRFSKTQIVYVAAMSAELMRKLQQLLVTRILAEFLS